MTEQENIEKFIRTVKIYKINKMSWRSFEEEFAKSYLHLTDEQIKNIVNQYYVENIG